MLEGANQLGLFVNLVQKHNTVDDAWVVIYGKVFDVTEWQHDHPGGDDILIRNAGNQLCHSSPDSFGNLYNRHRCIRDFPQRWTLARC